MQDKEKVLSYPRERIDSVALWIVSCFLFFARDGISTKRLTKIFQSLHYSNTNLGLLSPIVEFIYFYCSGGK